MTENEIRENAVYGVMLTSGQAVGIVEVEPGEKMFDCARRAIDCEWIEVVEPAGLQGQDYVLLIDEESKLKGDVHFVNCIASYLYESQWRRSAFLNRRRSARLSEGYAGNPEGVHS